MKRLTGLFLALALPVTFLVGCSGDDSADSTTTVAKSASSDSGSGTASKTTDTEADGASGGDMTVDEFCAKTKELAQLVQEVKKDPTSDAAKQATQLSKELTAKAQNLTSELQKDPSLAMKYGQCAAELGKAGMG